MATAGQDQLWDVGDVAVARAEFRNSSEALTDPTTVTLKVKDPSGNVTTYTYANAEITKSATGIYTKSITIDEGGKWTFGYIATGTVATAETIVITARPDPFA
jgi:hypothetical protein